MPYSLRRYANSIRWRFWKYLALPWHRWRAKHNGAIDLAAAFVAENIASGRHHRIDLPRHAVAARRSIDNFKRALNEPVHEDYLPGIIWKTVLSEVSVLRTWKEKEDDAYLADRLQEFYRTDLIRAHAGDRYLELLDDRFNVRLHCHMVLSRYNLLRKNLVLNEDVVTSTDVGKNMLLVPLGDKRLTFKTIRHAHYLNLMAQQGLLSNTLLFGELGAGSGELAILLKKTVPRATLVLFDLPSTLLVSSYNIQMTFPDAKVGLLENFADKRSLSVGDVRPYDFVLLPNWFMGRFPEKTFDLFYNTGSLSEMSYDSIRRFLEDIERMTRGSFFTSNRNIPTAEFGGEDIPLSRFPFSDKAKTVFEAYDSAADLYHINDGFGITNHTTRIVRYL